MADVFHMDTYLVCTAGFQFTANQGDIIKTLQNFIMSNGSFAKIPLRENLKLQPVARMPSYIALDSASVFFDISPDQCLIVTLNGALKELLPQMNERIVGFGYYH